jgi:flavin reductase (DIM6/NTAB) family NADH-FMN oxidoreductase RutF
MSGISFRELDPHDRYKLLCGVVVPRPIALVTTLDENGSVNAAPFSFFNVFSEDPPLLVLGLQHKADFSPKDTTRNIHRSGQFVVHLVDEALATAMNDCAIDFPSGDSEVEATGLKTLPSVDIAVPRLAAAPFALECRQHVALAFGPSRELLVGEVLRLHAREGLIDLEKMYVDFDVYRPIGRLFGNLYAAQRDTFALDRESRAQRSGRNVRPKSVMRELHGAECHGHGRLRRVDYGDPECLLQRTAVTRHAGATHHDSAGSVFVLERASDLDHLRQRSFARRRFRHAHVERPFPGQAIHQAHLPEVTDVAADRALCDRNDAESFGARQRGQHAAFGDAEHGPVGCFAADMQPRIAVAGNDEGGRMVVAFDEAAQRHRHAIDIGLALDPIGALGQRLADDLRSTFKVEWLQGLLQPLCYKLVGVGIDDENARS